MQKTNEILAVEAQAGNVEATHTLINNNMGLLVKIATRYIAHGHTREDLINTAVVGALESLESYDVAKGTKWSTHVYWHARKQVARLCVPERIGKSSGARQVFWKFSRAYNQLLHEKNREPTDKEMAERIGVSLATYTKARDRIECPDVSLDAYNPEEGRSLHEVIGTDETGEFYQVESMERAWIRDLADRFVETLTDKEAMVWNERIDCNGNPTAARTVAQFLGVTYQTVLNIEERLQAKFKRFVKANS